jgi:C1A family cysteine protease
VTIAKQNARAIAINSTARYGVNHLSDLTPEEFKKFYLNAGRKPKHTKEEIAKLRAQHEANLSAEKKAAIAKLQASNIDWVAAGLVTRVKNQAQCGSCWAFSATEELESMWIKAGKATNTTISLSPQQIVDCDQSDGGCGGGHTESAWDYIIAAGGQESNSTYPYTAEDGTCRFKKSAVVAKVKSYTAATSWYSESELLQTLAKEGPISVCVDAASWQNYESGIMTRLECDWIDMLDHCVQLTGYVGGAHPYWRVRNSWTTGWGLGGFIDLQWGWDTCGIADDTNYVTVDTN